MEFEKLIYQINHISPQYTEFDSVDGTNESPKRDQEFVQRLKKLLSYNLGKRNDRATLRMELEIVKEYIALQQMRYDFIIEMNIEDGSYLDQPTDVCFFQPLVETRSVMVLGMSEKISIQGV